MFGIKKLYNVTLTSTDDNQKAIFLDSVKIKSIENQISTTYAKIGEYGTKRLVW